MADKSDVYQERLWIRKSDGQLGIGVLNSFLGDLFLFAEFSRTETLNARFCEFLDDTGYKRSDFIDLEEWNDI